jgi:hypothetical protein
MKKRMLLVMPMPPPMHGSNVVNQYVASIELGDLVNSRILPIRYAREISDIGSFRFSKAVQFLVIWVKLLINLVMFRPHYVYFVPAVIGISYLGTLRLQSCSRHLEQRLFIIYMAREFGNRHVTRYIGTHTSSFLTEQISYISHLCCSRIWMV